MNPRIKVCGVTDPEGVRACLDAGIDAIGFNLARGPRRIDPERASELAALLPPFTTAVALVMDQPAETALALARSARCTVLQLHGDEPPETADWLRRRLPVIKAMALRGDGDADRLRDYPCDALLLDAPAPAGIGGGTGQTWDWSRLAGLDLGGRPLVLAGGLRPDNAAAAVAVVRPWAVDVASGVESAPGRKDPAKVAAFAAAVRGGP